MQIWSNKDKPGFRKLGQYLYFLEGNHIVKNSGGCYYVNNSWYPYFMLVWNDELNQYQYFDNNFINGFHNGLPAVFVPDPFRHYFINNRWFTTLPSEYVWNPNTAMYSKNKELPVHGSKKIYPNQPNKVYQYNRSPFYHHALENPRTEIQPHKYDEYFMDFTYGLEFETSGGNVSVQDLIKYNLIPLHDGSIRGHEYVTLPLTHTGITHYLRNITRCLTDSCVTNRECSLHVHMGNIPRNKTFLCALYELYRRLEAEVEMVGHPYKRSLMFLAHKDNGPKDHCKNLPAIQYTDVDELYNGILSVLNEHQMTYPDYSKHSLEYNKASYAKWEQTGRYYTLNLLNTIFSNGTIEYRYHPGTLSFEKTFYWMLIITAITKFATLNAELILNRTRKISLKEVLKAHITDTALYNNLMSYIKASGAYYTKELITSSSEPSSGFFGDVQNEFKISL